MLSTDSRLFALLLYTIQPVSTYPLIVHYIDSSLHTLSLCFIQARVFIPSHHTLSVLSLHTFSSYTIQSVSTYPFIIHHIHSGLHIDPLYYIQNLVSTPFRYTYIAIVSPYPLTIHYTNPHLIASVIANSLSWRATFD